MDGFIVGRQRITAPAVSLLVLLCALWGFQQVVVKVAVADGMPPVLMATLRSIGASLLVAGWIVLRDGRAGLRPLADRAAFWPGLLIGVVFGLEFLLLFPGLARTTASRGVLFLYTAPFFTALAAHVFLPGERLRRRQAMGLVIAFGGVVAAFADGLRGGGGSVVGDAMCGLSGMSWGLVTVYIKANPVLRVMPAARLLLYQTLGSIPLLLVAALLLGDLSSVPHVSALAWLCLAYQTVIVSFASYMAWFWLVMRYQAAVVSGFIFLAPLFGIAAGAAFLGEPATPALLIGLAAVAVGMRLVR
jgi:drug/metabolite transporter (DMT)-like permease